MNSTLEDFSLEIYPAVLSFHGGVNWHAITHLFLLCSLSFNSDNTNSKPMYSLLLSDGNISRTGPGHSALAAGSRAESERWSELGRGYSIAADVMQKAM